MRLRKAIKNVREINGRREKGRQNCFGDRYVTFTVAVECIKLQIYKYKKHSTNAFLARKKRDFRSM